MSRLLLKEGTVIHRRCLMMIFVEGTILAPRLWFDFFNIKRYCPIKRCAEKISRWEEQGAEIVYLTSRKKKVSVEVIRDILLSNGFVGSFLYYRDEKESYRDIVEQIKPGILVEDNCRSIGGAWQMCLTHVETSIKKEIVSVVVKEFGGLDHLSENSTDALIFQSNSVGCSLIF